MPSVVALWVKRAHRGPMDPVQEVDLVADRGVAGSADQGGRRQVTLVSREAWAVAEAELGLAVDPAARRANVLVEGLDLASSRGRILELGSCRLWIFGETRPCPRMDAAQPGLQRALDPGWRGGVFAKVLAGGRLRVGDEARWAGFESLPRRTAAAPAG